MSKSIVLFSPKTGNPPRPIRKIKANLDHELSDRQKLYLWEVLGKEAQAEELQAIQGGEA